MKASNSVKESFGLGLAKGPHCNRVQTTAKCGNDKRHGSGISWALTEGRPQQWQKDKKTQRVGNGYAMHNGAAKNHHSDSNRGKISQSCSGNLRWRE